MAAVSGPAAKCTRCSATTALEGIADTLALDYAGVDFALCPDGSILVFEANATMVAPLPGREPIWDYRRAAVAAVLAAARGDGITARGAGGPLANLRRH